MRGTNKHNTRAVQVEEAASSLNSGDAFVLLTPGNLQIWYGKGCSDDEKEVAEKIANNMKMFSAGEEDAPKKERECRSPAFPWTAFPWTAVYCHVSFPQHSSD